MCGSDSGCTQPCSEKHLCNGQWSTQRCTVSWSAEERLPNLKWDISIPHPSPPKAQETWEEAGRLELLENVQEICEVLSSGCALAARPMTPQQLWLQSRQPEFLYKCSHDAQVPPLTVRDRKMKLGGMVIEGKWGGW